MMGTTHIGHLQNYLFILTKEIQHKYNGMKDYKDMERLTR